MFQKRGAVARVAIAAIIVVIVAVAAVGAYIAFRTPSSTSSVSTSHMSSASPPQVSSSTPTPPASSTSAPPASTGALTVDTTCASGMDNQCLTSASTGQPPALSTIVTASIPLGGYESEEGHVGVDPATNTIYVSNGNQLTVVNSSSKTVVTAISLPGPSQTGVVVDGQTDVLFVPVTGSIVEIDGKTNGIVGTIPVDVTSLTINPNTNTLWGFTTGSLSVLNEPDYLYAIDAGSGAVLDNISLSALPVSLAVNPSTDMIYVAACGILSAPNCSPAALLIVNGTSHELQSNVPLSFDAISFPVVLDATTNVAYVMGSDISSTTLVSVGGTSGEVESSAPIGGSCLSTGGGSLAVNPATNQVYVSFASQPFFLVVDGSTGQVTNMFSSASIYDIIFNPQSQQIYATTSTSLLILSSTSSPTFVNTSLLPGGECLP